MSPFRFFTILCLTTVLIVWSPSVLWAGPKREIAIFEYEGVISAHDSASMFGSFIGILRDKVINLRREVMPADGEKFDYLKRIAVRYRGKDTFAIPDNADVSEEELVESWLENQAVVLCLLRGTFIRSGGDSYMVMSNFHLGALKEYLPYPTVSLGLPVTKEEFGNTKDSHSLVILYALAMDAKQREEDRISIALPLLAAAKNKLADIKRRSGGLSPGLTELENAINQAENDLRKR